MTVTVLTVAVLPVGAALAVAVSTVTILTVTVLVLELLTVAVLLVVGIVCSSGFPFHVLGRVFLAGVRVHLLFGVGLLLLLLFWAVS